MLKIKPLNRETSSDEDGPTTIRREAQEEITLDMYNKALRLQSCGEVNAAEDILLTLIEENIPQLECQGGLPKTMSTIKYSCYINIGTISMKKRDLSMALKYYLTASELDETDVTLWNKIGTLALKLDQFRKASYAFSKGLECSESHWPCLDQLISVLFALRDTVSCLQYIGKALMLDPDYTKGLVLRKNIYDCNPATLDYYKLYNPDYIYEPSLDVQFDKDEESTILADAQALCDRINKIEEAMGPKPLPCIPLPKPLKEYTWLSLGQTLTDLHEYISENNMSHFCTVDLKKCMSDTGETIELLEKSAFGINENAVENSKSERKEENKDCTNDVAQRMDAEDIVERRLSQNSDTNAACNVFDGENGTPIQTDNDEMDQDVEDADENTDSKIEKSKAQNRNKRRRDLVSDLQIWGWHSKRKTAKKARVEKDFTIEDALTRIIPSYLLPNGINGNKYNPCEDSMNTMELYKLHIEKEATSLMTPPHSPRCSDNDNYFGSDQEKEDVQKFWVQTWKCCDAVSLIEEYVYSLSELYVYKWPKKLFTVFIRAYNMFREHCEHPKMYSSEITFVQHRRDVIATLLYGELFTYNKELRDKNGIHGTSLCYMQSISGWEEYWDNEYVSIWCRVNWLRAHIFRKENQNFLAINALQLIQDVLIQHEEKLNRKYKLFLPNCAKYGVITLATVEKLLNILEMIDSLSQLEKLYNSQKYAEVADILKLTFNISNPPTHSKMGRPAQLAMLLHSLWYINLEDCFVWAEVCLHESLAHYLKPYKDQDKWEMILYKCVCILYEIVKKETVSILDSLTEEKRSRLVESLVSICCRQINAENSKLPLGTVTPWILLHYVLVREEHRQQARKIVKHIKKDEEKSVVKPVELSVVAENIEEKIPPSIAVLFSGHDFLGSKGWCLTDQGELLLFILDTIIDRLDTPIFELLREKIDIHLEQAFFCLYQHPSKKNKISRHLADHNVNPLPLTWDKAQQVYEFFCPDALPEFDSYKNISISPELEQLLQRIFVLVPDECNPQPLVSKINEFVNGNTDVLPEPIDFPQKTRSIYYLLGDYYFKQSEVKRSVKYFLLDLCINPLRLDTWACMALGIASQLESKLTHCERFKNEAEFLDKAKSAQVCFKQALNLANEHVTLWIEYGSFEYMVHSFCSRVLKYESDMLSMERFEFLENKKDAFLSSTGESFLKALELHQPEQCEIDERWLYHYMLGKIAEKKQQEPSEYLQHYITAAGLLNENNATYPEKINYNSPQHLALEVLEVHYRINASILKYLELHEGKPIPSEIGKMFKQCLDSSVFPKHVQETKPSNIKVDNSVDKTQLQVSGKETNGKTKVEEKIESRQETKICENICKEAVLEKKIELKNNENEMKKVNEILPEVEKCIDDLLNQIEGPKEINKTDVIMIDDSDEDKKSNNEGVDQKSLIDMDGKNVQEIMDAMMKQTMDNQPDIPMDTDSDVTPQEVVVPPDDVDNKLEVNEQAEVKSDNRDENIQKSVDETSTSSSSSDSDTSDSDSDDSSSSSSSSASENNVNINDSEVINLVDRCITGLEQCIRRLPQNYKALYRLAHLYFYYNKKKDLSKCRQLFLGEYKCKSSVLVCGLFSDRKTSNFFNGVWRIPSSEIDRPGSLAAHMGRCVSLLLQVLHDTNDHKSLLELCLQLRRIPDADKIYIRHSEREQLSDQALSMCIQCLRTQIKNMNNTSSPGSQKFLLDIFRMYQRSQKSLIHKESVFSSMLIDVYKKYMGDKVPENANVLDLAVKYCQQNRAAEKLKKQQQSQTLVPRSSSLTPAVPVLPTPSTIVPPVQPLKRPGLGRPRGRPPGPKIPGQVRSARGRSSMLNSNPLWNKSYDTAAYDYMKHYHDELLRQYSQTLSLTQQMNQLSSFLPTKTQNSLLGPMNLLQTMQQFNSGMNPLLNNPLAQNLNQVNPNFMKNMNDMYKIPTSVQSKTQPQGLTPEQIRLLSTLNHPTNVSNLMTAQMSNLASTSQPKTTPISKLTGTISKPTIVVSKSTAVTKLSSAIPKSISVSSFNKSNNSGFKYPSAEFSKPKMKDITKTTSSYMSKESSKSVIKSVPSQKEMEKTTSILKDRPNISITPVMQPITSSISPPKASAPPTKTLQEKLADKQKQHKNIDFASKPIEKASFLTNKPLDFGIKSNKALEFSVKNIEKSNYSSSITTKSMDFGHKSHDKPFSTISSSSYKTSTFSNLSIPSSLNVIPTFSKDTGISISQVIPKSAEINLPLNKPKSKSADMQSKLPISLSVIRKPEEKPERKQSSDDDVIIIE